LGHKVKKDGDMVDFYENAVTSSCLQAMDFLQQQSFMKEFYLAGGTALALQIGHRISTDLDWFSPTRQLLMYERETIRQALKAGSRFEVISEQDGMMFTKLWETDVSLIYQPHPLLFPPVGYHNVNLASPVDIGLMKLAAINSGGTRRDFVDLFCLRETATLDKLLGLTVDKYFDRPSFLAIAVRALAFFEDVEQQPRPHMLQMVKWEDVRAYCEEAARRLSRRLSGLQ